MRPIDRAIEFVEQNLHREILLTDVAKHSHISKFYFSRVFAEATGYSLMQYVRGRRLTEAAKKLATGAPAILDLALEFGYDSHAAFTRAFKKHFGISPKECRGQADSIRRLYVEKITMTEPTTITVYPPRIERDGPLMVVGLTARYSQENRRDGGKLMQEFTASYSDIPAKTRPGICNVIDNIDEDYNFDFMTGVTVSNLDAVPDGLKQTVIPEQKYAKFSHEGTGEELEKFIFFVAGAWLPTSELEVASDMHIQHIVADPKNPTVLKSEIWFPVK